MLSALLVLQQNAVGQTNYLEANYITPITNRQLDKNLPSVTLAGEAQVVNGMSSYTLPIDVPPGVQGIQPQLAIGYNSSGGNGQMGLGWNLSGLSAISRGGSTYFLDGVIAPVTLTTDDNLFLDGQRLVPYDGTGDQYRTLTETYQKIEFVDSDIIVVTQKDGMKRYYGGASARIQLKNPQTQVDITNTWLLYKVEDRNGNYITYEYVIYNVVNQAHINKIFYGGNSKANTLPKSEIHFQFGQRNDGRDGFMLGSKFRNSLLLRSILVKHNEQQYSKYDLNYSIDQTSQTGNNYSRLAEIKFQAHSADLNSIVINWESPSSEYSVSQGHYIAQTNGSPQGKRIYADFNADGLDDYITLFHRILDDGKCDIGFDGKPPLDIKVHEWEVYLGLNNGNGTFSTPTHIQTFVSAWKPDECIRSPFAGIYTGDFNGDGLMDFVLQKAFIDHHWNNYEADIYINEAANPGELNFARTVTMSRDWDAIGYPSYYTSSNKPFNLLVCDIDGDGKSDILHQGTLVTSIGPIFVAYYDLDQATHNQVFYATPSSGGKLDSALVGDFNGDGKIDFVLAQQGGTKVISFRDRQSYYTVMDCPEIKTTDYFRVGDFNGDGLSDFIIWSMVNSVNSYAGWSIRLNNGVGLESFFVVDLDNIGLNMFYRSKMPSFHLTAPYVFYQDLNGDGTTDVVFYTDNGGVEELKVYYILPALSTRKTTISLPANAVNPIGMQSSNEYRFDFVDFNGNGSPELFYNVRIDNTTSYYNFRCEFYPADKSKLVASILDGANTLSKFTYKALTDNSIYTRGTTQIYPNPVLIAPLYVVSKFEKQLFDATPVANVNYQYTAARINTVGLGLLGFEEIKALDNIQNRRIINTFGLPTTQPTYTTQPLLPLGSTVYSTTTNTLLSSTTFAYGSNIVTLNPSIYPYQFNSQLQEEKTIDFIHGTSSKTLLDYDSDGNLNQKTSYTYNNATFSLPFVSKTEDLADFTVMEGSWLNWLPSTATTSITRNGQPAATKTTNFTYEALTGNLLTETVYPGTEVQVITTFEYDDFGNITQEMLDPLEMTVRTNSYTYTPDGRFLETETNTLNWTVSYLYDDLLGTRTKQIDYNDLETEWEYDEFGRITKVTSPDNTIVEYDYQWFTGANPNLLFVHSVSGTNISPAEEFADGMGRVKLKRSKNQNDEWVIVRTDFDSRGRAYRTSQPYFTGSTPLWNTTTFDDNNRPTNLVTATGNSITIVYSGRTTTVTNTSTTPHQVKSSTVDADGLTLTSTDDGGNITYLYNSFGKPISVTGPSGSAITSGFDAYGRQVSLNDPAAGPMVYEYNALGELTKQTDNANNVYEMVYDDLGRLTQKQGSEGIYTNTYDEFLGKLESQIAPNGIATINRYDGLGRIEVYVEEVNGLPYEFHFEYNNKGQLSKKYYPNNFGVEYAYSTYGFLDEMTRTDNSQKIWEYVSENRFGQLTEYMLGDNITMSANYDAVSGLPTGVSNNNNWGMNYSFDVHTGNLLSRSHPVNGQTESFGYDALYRLTSYGTIDAPKTITFANTGSITFKTDAGNYTNDASTGRTTMVQHPTANGTPNGFEISDITQNISYTQFNSVETINEGNFDAFFTYGPDQQRRHMLVNQNGSTYIERYYIAGGQYERDRLPNGEWRNLTYLYTPAGLSGVFIKNETNQEDGLFFLHTDYQGSIMAIADFDGNMLEEYSYDPWGNRRDPENWQNIYTNTDAPLFKDGEATSLWGVGGILYRGYTFHEHLDCFALINMNGRMYDPILGRMLSPDKYTHSGTKGLNRYTYAFNNPLKFTDPNGELPFMVPVIVGALVYGTGNLAIQAYYGNVNNLGDGLNAFVSGAITGAFVGATWSFGLAALNGTSLVGGKTIISGIALKQGMVKAAAWTVLAGKTLNTVSTLGSMISNPKNGFRIALGKTYLDENRSFLGQTWQGISRHSWEGLQTWVGYNFSQFRNTFGQVDRVDYFGGATFSTGVDANSSVIWGVSLGNYINILRTDNAFDILHDPLLMHEYGHTFDSKIFGFSYLFAVGIPSARGADWTEFRANQFAAKYFGELFGVDWTLFEDDYPLNP